MKQVIQSDFPMPTLPSDAPRWAWDLMNTLGFALRLLANREDKQVHEGTEAEKPTADGSKRFYWATDTSKLYYDTGSWTEINPDQPAHPGTSTDEAIARYNGATGDLQNSLTTLDDNGSINVPSGQSYKVNGSNHTHPTSELSQIPTPASDHQLIRSNGTGGAYQDASVWVDDSGTVDIPSGQTYNINGSPHEHANDPYLRYSHRLSSGTNGGSSTGGSWQTYPINTEEVDTDAIGSLSSNQITLPAGTYYVNARGTMAYCGYFTFRLYNVTDTAALNPQAVSGATYNAGNMNYHANVNGYFTLSGTKAIEFQYLCASSTANYGLGMNTSLGVDEIYALVELWKVT